MRVTVYQATCNIGYAQPVFQGINRAEVVKEIAEMCRKTWEQNDWSEWWEQNQDYKADIMPENPMDDAPPIPETDEDIVGCYFHVEDDTPEGPWIDWNEFEIDLSPPYGQLIQLQTDRHAAVVRHPSKLKSDSYEGAGAGFQGSLFDEGDEIGDAIEGFILALTAAGFPVHLPEFNHTLAEYAEHLANEHPEE